MGNWSQETKERIRASIAPKPPDKKREQSRIRIEQTAQQRGSYMLPAKVLANRPGIAAKEAKTYQRSGAKDNNSWPCGTNQNDNHKQKIVPINMCSVCLCDLKPQPQESKETPQGSRPQIHGSIVFLARSPQKILMTNSHQGEEKREEKGGKGEEVHCHCVESSLTMICGEEGEKDRRRRRRRTERQRDSNIPTEQQGGLMMSRHVRWEGKAN